MVRADPSVARLVAVDLRDFLDQLDAHGLLLDLKKPVDPTTEVSRLMAELDRKKMAGLFTNVLPHGNRVVYSTLGSRQALALALGCDPRETTAVFRDRSRQRIAPVEVDNAPLKPRSMSTTRTCGICPSSPIPRRTPRPISLPG